LLKNKTKKMNKTKKTKLTKLMFVFVAVTLVMAFLKIYNVQAAGNSGVLYITAAYRHVVTLNKLVYGPGEVVAGTVSFGNTQGSVSSAGTLVANDSGRSSLSLWNSGHVVFNHANALAGTYPFAMTSFAPATPGSYLLQTFSFEGPSDPWTGTEILLPFSVGIVPPICSVSLGGGRPDTIIAPYNTTLSWASAWATSAKYSCTGSLTASNVPIASSYLPPQWYAADATGNEYAKTQNGILPFNNLPVGIESCTVTVTGPGGTHTCSDSISIIGKPCKLPWDNRRTIDSGESLTAYQACDSEIRMCTDGVLSGTFLEENPPNGCPTCSASWSPAGPLTVSGASTLTVASSRTTSATYTCTGPAPISSTSTPKNSSIVFPALGAGIESCTFNLVGTSGDPGHCSASIEINSAVTNGACGTASSAKHVYASTDAVWGSYTACDKGIANPILDSSNFPDPGGSFPWTCDSPNGGTNAPCSGARAASQMCGNGIKEGTEICDSPAGNGTCPKTCNSVCSAINDCPRDLNWRETSPN
jgi:hypothetical protein